MVLNNGKVEITLDFSTASYMALKEELKCENLRKTLLQGCNRENFAMLAKGLKAFSGGKLTSVKDAYGCIDHYCKENEVSKIDMFLQFIVEVGENGFFGERKTLEEMRELAVSPETLLDMEDLTEEAVKMFRGRAMERLVGQMLGSTSTTGVTTLPVSVPPRTAAE